MEKICLRGHFFMKKLKKIAFLLLFSLIIPIFSGCTSGSSSLYLTSFPSKIVYEIGEKVSFKGLKLESLNTDGTNCNVSVDFKNIEDVDTSTAGEKIVKITKGDLSVTFSIYVAHHVVESKEQLKQTINDSADGDIIYIKKGEYKPDSQEDESLYNILIDKKLTIIGDGSKKTLIHGNFLVGAMQIGEDFLPLEDFEQVKILNLGFVLDSTQTDGYLNYEGPYQKYDVFGAIKTFNSKKITISNCLFQGYSYGINASQVSDLTLTKNIFKNIKINGVKVTESIKNASICRNVFMDIGTNSLAMENGKQAGVGAVFLSFQDKGNAGVIVANNSFVRIGLNQGSKIYVSAGADELEADNSNKLTNGSYMNNSAIIFLVSASTNNLQVGGIILSMNNYGQTLENVRFGTNSENLIEQAGVYINEN